MFFIFLVNGCDSNSQCPHNEVCSNGYCECPPPFVKDGSSCRHPCEWTSCGQNAECYLDGARAKCKCKPGCSGDPDTGCQDINECTSLLPIDPNGPCGVGAICVNVLGSYRCECPLGSRGNPFEEGCLDVKKCSSDDHCPPDTICQRQSGTCVDACSASGPICGPNSDCIPQSHKPLCVCRPGYHGNPNDLSQGCISRKFCEPSSFGLSVFGRETRSLSIF